MNTQQMKKIPEGRQMRMPSFVSTAILLDRKKRKKRSDLILPGKVRIDGFEKRNPQAAFVDLGI